MTITAVGSFAAAGSTTQSTLAVSPTAIGDIFCLATTVNISSKSVTGCTGGGVTTWNSVLGPYSSTTNNVNLRLWYGVITATGASTITITFSAALGTDGGELVAQQFHSSLPGGGWAVDTSNTLENSASTTVTFPSLTPVTSGEIYYGYAFNVGNSVVGSTSGYTYLATIGNNIALHNPSCTSSAQAPTSTQSTSSTSIAIAMMIREISVSRLNINQAVRRGSYY